MADVVEIDGVARNEALKSYQHSLDNGYSPRASMDGAIREYLTRARLSQAGAGGVVVKPLEWHRSRMTPWNGDYHTVPTGYSVRCADENGWKWQGLGAHGYASSPERAQAGAQEHHSAYVRAYVRAALAPSPSAGVGLIDQHLTPDLMDDGNCCAGKLAPPATGEKEGRS